MNRLNRNAMSDCTVAVLLGKTLQSVDFGELGSGSFGTDLAV
jgi:hypothetical protein